jgi:glycosyltransferase involved in cell wall biosynthesis
MNRIIWVKPRKEKNISIGRKRIAESIAEGGNYEVEVRNGVDLGALKLLLFGRYDCLIGTTRIGAFAGLVAKMRAKKVIIDHVDPIGQFKVTNGKLIGNLVELVEDLAFRFADAVFVTNEEDKLRVSKRAKRVVESRLGIDYESFANTSESAIENAGSLLKLKGVNPADQIVTYIGGFEDLYHLDELISAMRLLENWQLVLAGSGSIEGKLRDMVQENDLQNVHFLGSLDHELIPGILYLSKVCVTLCETPRQQKILEYAASKTPIVAPEKARRIFPCIQVTGLEPSDIASNIEKAVEIPESELVIFQKEMQEYDYKTIAILYESAIQGERD